jgi:glycerol uptake facilitator-like aquaporin
MLDLLKKLLVEFAGSLLFLYVIISTGNPLAIVASLYIAILVGGPISGGHFNPMVSCLMAYSGKIPYKDLGFYIFAQLLGGFGGYSIYKLM